MDTIALILSIIGSLNWGLVSLFKFDLVAWIFGGQDAVISRIIYAIIAIAGLWCITFFFRKRLGGLSALPVSSIFVDTGHIEEGFILVRIPGTNQPLGGSRKLGKLFSREGNDLHFQTVIATV